MVTFDFSNGLEIIEFILEGPVGTYLEVSESDYKSLFNALPQEDGLKEFVEGYYLIPPSSRTYKLENYTRDKFTVFPFSNTKEPILIFEKAKEFAKENKDSWEFKALDNIKYELADMYVKEILVNELRNENIT